MLVQTVLRSEYDVVGAEVDVGVMSTKNTKQMIDI